MLQKIWRPVEFAGSRIDGCPSRCAPESRLKERLFAGKSASVAEAVKVSRLPSSTLLLPIVASSGAWLISPTVMLMVSKSSRPGVPSSVTRTVTECTAGPCVSVGVQLNCPVVGSMVAPAGALGVEAEGKVVCGKVSIGRRGRKSE